MRTALSSPVAAPQVRVAGRVVVVPRCLTWEEVHVERDDFVRGPVLGRLRDRLCLVVEGGRGAVEEQRDGLVVGQEAAHHQPLQPALQVEPPALDEMLVLRAKHLLLRQRRDEHARERAHKGVAKPAKESRKKEEQKEIRWSTAVISLARARPLPSFCCTDQTKSE